jgi:hypothetical protein
VDKENITPGGDKTCAAMSLGSLERISFNGSSSIPLICLGAGLGKGAGSGTAALGAGAGAGGAEGAEAIGFRAATGAGERGGFSVIGTAVTGGLAGFENSFLNTPNMDRALPHTA